MSEFKYISEPARCFTSAPRKDLETVPWSPVNTGQRFHTRTMLLSHVEMKPIPWLPVLCPHPHNRQKNAVIALSRRLVFLAVLRLRPERRNRLTNIAHVHTGVEHSPASAHGRNRSERRSESKARKVRVICKKYEPIVNSIHCVVSIYLLSRQRT